MRRELRWLDLVPLIAAALVFVATVAYVSEVRKSVQFARLEVMRQRGAAVDASVLLRAILEAESNQRGYLLTNQRVYRDSYEEAVRHVPPLLDKCRQHAIETPGAGPDFRRLAEQTQAKMAEMAEAVRLSELGQRQAGLDVVQSDRGRQAMEEIRSVVATLQSNWLEQVEQTTDAARRGVNNGALVTCSASLIGLLLMALSTLQLNAGFGKLRQKLADVQDAEKRYQLLADRLQTAGEQERGQMARSIHDHLGQELTAIKIDLARMLPKLPKESTDIQRQIEKTSAMVDGAILMVRNISMELRPAILDQLGLASALEWQLREFGERTGIDCKLETVVEDLPLNKDQQIALFRIAQEALTNVARHAQAHRIRVRLSVEKANVSFHIEDDGVGMPTASLDDYRSIGLFGMQERARVIGGHLQIDSQQGEGTCISVTVPLAAAAS